MANASPVLAVGQIPNPSQFNSLEEVINTALALIRPAVILVLIGVLMYGGYVRLTAQDNADKQASSVKIIVSGLIGFAIIVLAPVLVDFFGVILGIQGNLLDLSN